MVTMNVGIQRKVFKNLIFGEDGIKSLIKSWKIFYQKLRKDREVWKTAYSNKNCLDSEYIILDQLEKYDVLEKISLW